MKLVPRPAWPEGKSFTFTVFDDPDFQTLNAGSVVYAFLRDLGFRTTRGVWTIPGPTGDANFGVTCADKGVLPWLTGLQRDGFEMGYHNATTHTSAREQTLSALDKFREYFGHDPITASQHYLCNESVYWGAGRLSGIRRIAYEVLTGGKNLGRFHGHIPSHPEFWGDLCQTRVEFMRNFVFRDINTLKLCPFMPYHDPARPYVRMWYASTEGVNVKEFVNAISEENQDRLEAEGGACIMYTHFAYGFVEEDGRLNPRFRELMTRLAKKNGWFPTTGTLLRHLSSGRSRNDISAAERNRLENSWLFHKIRYGSA